MNWIEVNNQIIDLYKKINVCKKRAIKYHKLKKQEKLLITQVKYS